MKLTLIELMIVLAIIVILASIVFGGVNSAPSSISWGINGMTETRCIDGYKYVIGEGGQARQVLNADGGGVKCS